MMDDVYEDIDNYNPKKKKLLIAFGDMIADIMSKKNFRLKPRNYLLDVENYIFYLFLLLNLIFLF